MIDFSGVSKSLQSKTIIFPLDLHIPSAQTTILLGPSGSGKSTLLRMIIGLIKPDTGKIAVNNIEINENNLIEVRRHIGYVIQEGGLFPHLTARGNVALLAKHLGLNKATTEQRMVELCDLMRLSNSLLSSYPSELSGGQRQRISLMRALMLDPEILLLDEPMGALDPMVRTDLQRDLRSIFSKLKKTVVMVTHDLAEAESLGDQGVFMQEGRIIHKGVFSDFISDTRAVFGIH